MPIAIAINQATAPAAQPGFRSRLAIMCPVHPATCRTSLARQLLPPDTLLFGPKTATAGQKRVRRLKSCGARLPTASGDEIVTDMNGKIATVVKAKLS